MTGARNLWLAALAGGILGWATAGIGQKRPDVRIWDVVVLGPWLLGLAIRKRPLTDGERAGLAFTAGATVTHNARNAIAAASRQPPA